MAAEAAKLARQQEAQHDSKLLQQQKEIMEQQYNDPIKISDSIRK